jgi:hypothetical protein
VPHEIVNTWIPKATQIGQLEIFAGPVALDTWQHLLVEADVLHFIDNNAALSSLIKGYSPKLDSVRLVGDYWLRVSTLKSNVFLDRVESKSNCSDGPSRADDSLMKEWGAVFVPPNTTLLQTPHHQDPRSWFSSYIVGAKEEERC